MCVRAAADRIHCPEATALRDRRIKTADTAKEFMWTLTSSDEPRMIQMRCSSPERDNKHEFKDASAFIPGFTPPLTSSPATHARMAPLVGRRILALRYIRDAVVTPTVVGLVTYYLTSRFRLPYKPLLVLGGVLVGWPAMFSLRVRYQGWCRARRAKALGAVPAPESRGKSFGDIDVAREIQDMGKNGFIGKL